MADKRPVGRPNQAIETISKERLIEIEKKVKQFADRKRKLLTEAAQTGFEVRQRRLALGIAQEKLAQESGVALQSVFRIERGLPAPGVLPKVVKALTRLESKKRGTSKAPRK